MSQKRVGDLKPFLSVLIIIATLFVMVFFKMEVRRMGYLVLKENQIYRKQQDRYRLRAMEFAQTTRHDRVKSLAKSQLTLHDAEMGQIIQLTGQIVAVPQ